MSDNVHRISVALIWAQSDGGIIGHNGSMPWHLPEDLAHFKELTLDSAVIMGRKTWDSLPSRFRPLPGRRNIVVTRDESWGADGAEIVHSVDAAIDAATSSADFSSAESPVTVWVIGGAQIFAAVAERADRIEITEIREHFDGDTLAPARDENWVLVASDPVDGWHTSSSNLQYRFLRYENPRAQQR